MSLIEKFRFVNRLELMFSFFLGVVIYVFLSAFSTNEISKEEYIILTLLAPNEAKMAIADNNIITKTEYNAILKYSLPNDYKMIQENDKEKIKNILKEN